MNQISNKLVKTRKPHQCFACLREFDTGTDMYRSVNKNDGDVYQLYTCNTCESILSMLDIDNYDDGFPEGVVIESARNQYDRFVESSPDLNVEDLIEEFYQYLVENERRKIK